ncbi:polyhomeotic-like protein 1 isoform X3 [Haliotis cracherodii]|uniref:polyhomeotic-like protein 1 isoform X3 n=1 Tax=Haliotis rufescens TaxID=6454 RepID=UPI001EAFB09C|nr:polyhomeotic-like protein 1 isoform X3 [Haliotis rufescens]
MSEQRTSTSTPGTPTAPPQAPPIVTMANIRSSSALSQIPQVQVIPQPMHSPPYLSNFPYNPQIMLQNAAVAMAQQQLNMAAAMQGRPPSVSPTSPGLMSPTSSQVGLAVDWTGGAMLTAHPSQRHLTPGMIVTTSVTATSGSNVNSVKGSTNGNKSQSIQGPTQGQATALVGGKPAVMSAQAAAQPLVLGQIGAVFSGQGTNNPNFVAQVASSKGQAVSLSHPGQPQLITSQAPLRLSQPQLVTNTGQIITSQPMLTNQAVLQAMASLQQGFPLAAHQPLLNHAQSPAILAGQSLYIRTANPIQTQQSMMAANMQAALANSMKGGKMEMPQNLQVNTKPSGGSSKSSSQTGKTLLPSKATTAKIPPTHISGQATKLNIPTVIPKQSKGRTKSQSKSSSSVPSTPTSTKTPPVSHSKPATPTNQPTIVVPPAKSQSDSEVERAKKSTPPPDITSTKEKSGSVTVDEGSPEEKDKDVIDDNDKPPVITKEVETPMDTSMPDKPPPPLEPATVVEKQKAIVKPHILTHIIEGFVIQEGPEPFPVQRSSLLTEFIPPKPTRTDKDSDEELSESLMDLPPPLLEPEGLPTRSSTETQLQPNMLKCEYCGKMATAVKFRRSKRFCSMACAKRYNVACSRRVGLFKNKAGTVKLVKKRKHPLAVRKGWRPGRGGRLAYNINMRLPEEASSSNSGQEETSSSPTSPIPLPDMEMDTLSPSSEPSKWTVMEVYEFIKSLPGCATYAEEFLSQEIDGQALLLLKEDHLMTAMNIKLGPALKICARISSLKDECV